MSKCFSTDNKHYIMRTHTSWYFQSANSKCD